MDDIRLFAKDDYQLKGFPNTVNYFRDSISMNFGLDNWAKLTFKNGSNTETQLMDLDFVTELRELEQEAYNYQRRRFNKEESKVRITILQAFASAVKYLLEFIKYNISHKHKSYFQYP